jgi:hypothetical protein
MENYKFLGLQIALFFKEPLLERVDLLSVGINEIIDVFDDSPQTLPIPESEPDFPILILKSKDGMYQCNLFRSRVDLFLNISDENKNKDFIEHKKRFDPKIQSLFEFFSKKSEINRVGYIAKLFFICDSPSNLIEEKFLKNKVNRIKEINLRLNIGETTDNLKLNHITKVLPGQLVKDESEGILIQKDINSVKEEEHKFDKKLFKEFLQYTENKFSFKAVNEFLK